MTLSSFSLSELGKSLLGRPAQLSLVGKAVFERDHPFVLVEPEPRRRFKTEKCAAQTAYGANTVFVDEKTDTMYSWQDVVRLGK